MADYNSSFTGLQIDTAIGKVGTAVLATTAQNLSGAVNELKTGEDLATTAVDPETVTTSNNLAPYPLTTEDPHESTSRGITYIYNYDGSLTVSGTATESIRWKYVEDTAYEAGTYTFLVETPTDYDPSPGYNTTLSVGINETELYLTNVIIGNGKKVYYRTETVSADFTACMYFRLSPAEEVHATIYPQIISGSIVKPWEAPVGASLSKQVERTAERLGAKIDAKADASSALSLTLAAGSWSSATPPTQTLQATGVTSNSNIIVGLAGTATSAQYDEAAAAKLVCTAQGANSITMTCYGDTPTGNIPISVVILG